MLQLPLIDQPLRTRTQDGSIQVWDEIRRRWVALTPEEHVRQRLLRFLVQKMGYPASLIAVERGLSVGHTTLRFDAVIFRRGSTTPWMLIECKAPSVPLTEETLHQLLHYHRSLSSCRYWLMSNGHDTRCAEQTPAGDCRWLDSLPAYEA